MWRDLRQADNTHVDFAFSMGEQVRLMQTAVPTRNLPKLAEPVL